MSVECYAVQDELTENTDINTDVSHLFPMLFVAAEKKPNRNKENVYNIINNKRYRERAR